MIYTLSSLLRIRRLQHDKDFPFTTWNPARADDGRYDLGELEANDNGVRRRDHENVSFIIDPYSFVLIPI